MSLTKPSKVKTLEKSSIFTKTIVQMNDVSASYDSKNYVLKDIKMSIDRGTNYAIVGHSGSGKSTLLRLINGMMNPTRGKILVDYQKPNISDKKFKPHVTIFRVKNKIEDMSDKLEKFSAYYFGKQTVSEIKLKKSELTPNGPIYTDLLVVKGKQ